MSGLDNIYVEMQDEYTKGFEAAKSAWYFLGVHDHKMGTVDQSMMPKTDSGKQYAFCDLCSADAYDTPEALKADGWQLLPNECFCPNHD